jgi:hypothetical protein
MVISKKVGGEEILILSILQRIGKAIAADRNKTQQTLGI